MNKFAEDVFYTPLLMDKSFLEKAVLKASGEIKAGRDIPDPEEIPWKIQMISRVEKNIAIIDIKGVICDTDSFWCIYWGYTPVKMIREALDFYVKSSEVDAVIMNFDSPGGTVDGVEETSNHIFNSRGIKPIIGICNSLCASAAYWIGSACDELHISSKTAGAGSVGVYVVHGDFSERLENEGIKFTQITSTSKKALTPSFKPLSEEGRNELQRQVDTIHEVFISHVSRNRSLSKETIKADLEGLVFFGEESVKNGFTDSIKTLDSIVEELNLNSNLEDIDPMTTETLKPAASVEISKISVSYIKENHSSVYEEIHGEGEKIAAVEATENISKTEEENKAKLSEAKENGFMEGKISGKEQERKRILNIHKKSKRGFEALALTSIKEGHSSKEFVVAQAEEVSSRGITINILEKDNQEVDFVSLEENGKKSEEDSLLGWMVEGGKEQIEANNKTGV